MIKEWIRAYLEIVSIIIALFIVLVTAIHLIGAYGFVMVCIAAYVLFLIGLLAKMIAEDRIRDKEKAGKR